MPTGRQRSSRSKKPRPRRNGRLDAAVGTVLRELRLALPLTQEQLAWRTEIERAFISEVERGVKGVTITMLYRLAEGLEVPAHQILKAADDLLRKQ